MGNLMGKRIFSKKIVHCYFPFFVLTIIAWYAFYTHTYVLSIYNGRLSVFWEDNIPPAKNTSLVGIESIDKWHFVDNDVYIYSAYWEFRFHQPFVRIIGIGLTKGAKVSHLRCLLKYNEINIRISSVKIKIMPDNHDTKHTATFYLCQANLMPTEVAIIVNNMTKEPVWLKVRLTKPVNNLSEGKAAICVRPFFGKFRNHNLQVAEFIAFYQIMGVTQFIFYDYQTHPHLKKLLFELKRNGLPLDLLPWNLSDDIRSTWMLGQIASIADCVYRCSRYSEFVVILDVDEFIVPSQNMTLQQLVQHTDVTEGKRYANYMFRNAFFCMEYPDDPEAINVTIPLLTQKKIRYRGIFPPYIRTKSIVRPIGMITPGIHFTWSFMEIWEENVVIDPSVAMVNHYRYRVCGGASLRYGVVNLSAKRYKDLLLQSKPIKIWRKLNFTD